MSYYDYNLAHFENTRGGFILEEKIEKKRVFKSEPPVSLDPDAPKCKECSSPDILVDYKTYFNILVCKLCQEANKDYKLMTKTQVKEDYLFTEPELKDTKILPYMRKKSKKRYHEMYLYLQKHVEEYAIRKWGSLSQLNKEHEERKKNRSKQKIQKFKKQMQKLRTNTRTSLWYEEEKTHKHQFENNCCSCGMTLEIEYI